MQNFKPWHGILMLAAAVALGFGVFTLFSREVPRATQVYLIDVASGEVFRAPIGGQRALTLPAKHPESGERTLLPIQQSEDGGWRMNPRYVNQSMKERGSVEGIDLNTGEITLEVSTGSARQYERPGRSS